MKKLLFQKGDKLKKNGMPKAVGIIQGISGDNYLVEWFDPIQKSKALNWPLNHFDICYYLDIESNYEKFL